MPLLVAGSPRLGWCAVAGAPLVLLAALVTPTSAAAAGLTETGDDLRSDRESVAEIDGYLRGRGEALYNLDLDRGPTPSGQYLYPLPLANPSSPWLTGGDLRLRTDLSLRPKKGRMSVNLRVDVLDNIAFGSTPRGTPLTTTSQRPPGPESAFQIERAYGRVLTPIGLLAVGRMGADWGLGIVANSGDCRDCNTGDSADRVAFITPLADHIFGVAYDLAYRGPTTDRPPTERSLDLDPSDDVRTVTFVAARERPDWVRERRRAADRSTFDYGAYVSHRWQQNDIPVYYVPTSEEVDPDPSQVVERRFRAIALDGWLRFDHPVFRAELELAYLGARIGQTSLVPGLRLDEPITSRQFGGALETVVGPPDAPVHVGVDAGFASGDEAPGFGATSQYRGEVPQPGDLQGAQADYPDDIQANNFRFHPDYRVDRILFHEIIGTVTDATYVRPHVDWLIGRAGPSELEFRTAAPVSWAVESASTPGGASPLGLEVDPSLIYRNTRGFWLALDYGVLFPFEGLGARERDISLSPAQKFKLSAIYQF
jgi:uncharacterized protein (TIGR04551 family)